jgi:hypothetical protein
MRLWVNPPLNRLQATPDIDVTSAHVAEFSGVYWKTVQGQVVDEISINSAGGTWTSIFDFSGRPDDTALLLTDGTAIIHQSSTPFWRRLTPSVFGSYINGSLSYTAVMQPPGYAPDDFASAVLPDGRVIVEGGEYNNGYPTETNLGAIYDPTMDTWTPVAPPTGWTTIGDGPSVVLPDGTFMLGNCCAPHGEHNLTTALLDPIDLTWTATGFNQAGYEGENGWTLLPGMNDSPSGSVLTVNNEYAFPLTDGRVSERYFPPPFGFWIPAGSTLVELYPCDFSAGLGCEIGPAVLRPDGTVFAEGASFDTAVPANTAFYHTSQSDPDYATWTAGPVFPCTGPNNTPPCLGATDAPASLLPNGNVLVDAGPSEGTPTSFFEFTLNNQWISVSPPTSGDKPYLGRMLLLPTGQVLFTDQSDFIYIYTPSNQNYDPAWAPQIARCPPIACIFPIQLQDGNTISGLQLNGLSQGAMFGDDAQMATNYPLVRITPLDGSGDVYYCRTHDHSSMGVATGNLLVSTVFDCSGVPYFVYAGLQVVANGIPSNPIVVYVGDRAAKKTAGRE